MVTGVSASVIIRSKNSVGSLGRALRGLRSQDVDVEVVVVDSGSTDGTLEVARRLADAVVEISPQEFSYGRALNRGAAVASGDIHMALSSHCEPPNDHWAAEVLDLYSSPCIAGTNGAQVTADGHWIDEVHYQTMEDVLVNPLWGFSNHASSWRATVWQRFPFREDLLACEDKEWSWRVLAAGMTIAYSSTVAVSSAHRREAGFRSLYQRVHRETEVLAGLGAVPAPTSSDLLREWWSSFPIPSRHPRVVRRFGPHRAVEIVAAHRGARAACALPGGLPELITHADPRAGTAYRGGACAGETA